MNTKIKVIQAIAEEEKAKVFKIREEVFVKEQKVPAKEEFDEFEKEAAHFLAMDNTGMAIGSARWRKTDKGAKLERFTVKKTHRGQGIGAMIVGAVIEDITTKMSTGTYLYLHAQLDAVPLYAKFGFEKKGDLFDECGIMHYLMWRRL